MFATGINIESLEYKPPTSNKAGGKVVNISTKAGSNDWNDKIRFQMSENDKVNLQTAVWGLSVSPDSKDASRKTLELTIESDDLLEWLHRLDEHNIKTATRKSFEWFKKELTEDQVRAMYVFLVKPPTKEGNKPTVRVKVKCEEPYPTNVFMVTSQQAEEIKYAKVSSDEISRNAKCMVMCETVGLWFMSRTFGMSLTATDIMVWRGASRPTGINSFTLSGTPTLSEQDSMVVD